MSRYKQFLETLSSDHTRRAYEVDLRRFFGFLRSKYNEVDTRRLEVSDITAFLKSMADEDLSESTRRRRVAAVRKYFDWLVHQNVIDSNPARHSRVSVSHDEGGTSRDRRYLDREEIAELMSVCDRSTTIGYRNYTLILLIVYGALRRSEVAALNVQDVRPLGRHWIVDVEKEGRFPGGYVRIPDSVASVVQELADRYESYNGPLWRSLGNRNRGKRLGADAIYNVVRRLGHKANLGDLSIDILRRSALKLALAYGAGIGDLQKHARVQSPEAVAKYADGVEAGSFTEAAGLQDGLLLQKNAA